jgi:hypothetical protein
MEKPAPDSQVLAEALHVGDQVMGRVERHVRRRIARVRETPTAAALVEENNAVAVGIEQATFPGARATARAAMHHHAGFPAGFPQTSQ